ncbi:cubilin-like [Nilaparvata lugens]|uniref:cubilin-like n=1 Tax=Nilaparvata lugens TaxID=108931 RepID=UPI00193E2AD3|nr:cubilin-like [Nilaparvata lugens]
MPVPVWEICYADLASVNSPEEERFVVSKIRESRDYSTNAIYWLGGQMQGPDDWHWVDNSPMTYTAWLKKPGLSSSLACLGMQWASTPTPLLPSGLYWQAQDCSSIGGYVCKKENQVSGTGLNLNGTVNGTEGRLTSPRYPAPYFHNLDYWVNISAPEAHRIVIHFTRLDLEAQAHCLYDFLQLGDANRRTQPKTLCGHYDPAQLERLNFVSESNAASLRFHSDYSISGGGYSLMWHAVDVSGCPLQTLTAKEGVITSPNYPHFLLAHLDCSTTILAPAGRRVWLEITDFDMSLPDALLELSLGGGTERIQPFMRKDLLSDGVFLSVGERLQIRLKTGDEPKGRGFRAVYKTVSSVHEGRVLDLGNTTGGTLNWVNYPLNPPSEVDFTDRLVVPLGKIIHLQFYNTEPSLWDDMEGKKSCADGMGEIEVKDTYADPSGNGTWWKLCEAPGHEEVVPLSITSYLNTIQIRQINSLARSGSKGIKLNVSVSVQTDLNYKVKLLQSPTDSAVESCRPNPCQNGGKCASSSNKKSCQCIGHFTGMFCALTVCELEPCLHGRCELTATGFTCHCLPGYIGETCDTKKKPCADKPCEGRGECIPRSDTTFYCRCHAWWEGPRCERRLMMRIPYKPLSERMLQEPFWLGLITVTVVLGVLGLFWCAKRHFPEKLEKLLAEEADRNRHCLGVTGRTPSVREQLGGGAGPLYTSGGQLAVPGGGSGSLAGASGGAAGRQALLARCLAASVSANPPC